MAEMNIPDSSRRRPGGRRSKKLSTKVDLTPMVDLGFLLITFFIFTTTMSVPKATGLVMPKDSHDSTQVGLSTALTVLPIKNNQVFYYHGELADALKTGAFGIASFSIINGIGQVIREKKAALEKVKPGNSKELMLMIKPTAESNYNSFVNVMDEVMINDVKHYALMDITDKEKEVIATKIASLN